MSYARYDILSCTIFQNKDDQNNNITHRYQEMLPSTYGKTKKTTTTAKTRTEHEEKETTTKQQENSTGCSTNHVARKNGKICRFSNRLTD
jgi:hypothetical protein